MNGGSSVGKCSAIDFGMSGILEEGHRRQERSPEERSRGVDIVISEL